MEHKRERFHNSKAYESKLRFTLFIPAVASATGVLIAPLWHRAGDAVTHVIILAYRKLLARPIASGWLRR
ncbi:hypothetical protein C0Z18_06705 [Trinickia dabaoshanensis]|uniref:Uncharacterized protein n=1 Tax=Trinickia dabaoshanensis TaxID=564714 RepID=A0A2N7VWM1_9BURK|nr:hypothetical protein C0Z18_06705 [Trinickia dabaoshanensis]